MYLGITVSGFPNLFMLYGPNTNLGHNSIVYMLESQIQYVKDAIANLCAAPGTSFEVKSDVQNSFNAKLQHALRNTVWAAGTMQERDIAESGKIINNWSGLTFTYRRLTSRFDTVNYHALDRARWCSFVKTRAKQCPCNSLPRRPEAVAPILSSIDLNRRMSCASPSSRGWRG